MNSRLLESSLRKFERSYVTDAEFQALLKGTSDSRYGKVKRLLAQGKLLHIRRGLYCLTEELGCRIKPHPYELAQHVYGPSYISLESALSFHGLIPERVYSITSVTAKRAKEFNSPLGLFSYLHVPPENLLVGVELVNDNGYPFFVAKPWKAICDYMFCYKKNWNSKKPLLKDLRIELDNLPILSGEEIQLFEEYYQSARVKRFLAGIRGDQQERFSYER
jgi:predicted transcriptional regulator of viral defense system